MDQNTITQVINPHSLQATQDAGLPATLVPLHDLCLILSLSLSLRLCFVHTYLSIPQILQAHSCLRAFGLPVPSAQNSLPVDLGLDLGRADFHLVQLNYYLL